VRCRRRGTDSRSARKPRFGDASGVSTMNHDDQPARRGTGTFLGLPYDWRRPAWSRVRERAWNPRDPRLLTAKSFGWGYDISFYELLARLRIGRR